MQLNHGIALSNDGKTLYASSDADVFAWPYDAVSGTVSAAARTVVRGMAGTGHSTRTLVMSARRPGMLLVSKGSGENVDARARDAASGVSQIRAFNMTNLLTATTTAAAAYTYASQGVRLGWGLRNSVGVAEEPTTGGVFSVENSVDQLVRAGVDVHQDNPGEELNFHGFLPNASSTAEEEQQQQQGGNYGYPDCFSLWDPDIPDAGSLRVGEQFAPEQSRAVNDTTCARDRVAPRLVFPAHTAPLDIAFSADGTAAYIAFHGSCE